MTTHRHRMPGTSFPGSCLTKPSAHRSNSSLQLRADPSVSCLRRPVTVSVRLDVADQHRNRPPAPLSPQVCPSWIPSSGRQLSCGEGSGFSPKRTAPDTNLRGTNPRGPLLAPGRGRGRGADALPMYRAPPSPRVPGIAALPDALAVRLSRARLRTAAIWARVRVETCHRHTQPGPGSSLHWAVFGCGERRTR